MHTKFCQKMEDLGIDGRTELEWSLGKQGGRLYIGFVSLRIGTSGRLS